ncbi:MAG: alpha-ketoacid dehydrogenase subunit beta [Dehalococcoidales bacterium]|nr:alpha-ketoacid dehydrogenase subunit beta [Dehalococcoidales bacterium]
MSEKTYGQAFNEAVDEEMKRDSTVFVMGEDVGKAWGGPLGEYKGLFDKYGAERVRQTPISETAFVGAGIGAAAVGMRPIVTLMFADFWGTAGDEILNQVSKMRYMFGGKLTLPLVITSYSGGGMSAAAQHSKCIEGLLISIPGIKIVSPSTPKDIKGLMTSAIRENNPVAFFIHKALLVGGVKGEVPDGEFTIPLGKADVKRAGKDVTVVAISYMVHKALVAAAELEKKGISVEVIDPRTLVPLDKEVILASVKKTGRLAIIDEEPKTGSVAGEIAAIVAEEAFSSLKAPIKRVCAPDTPVPFSRVLEKYWMPDEDNLIKAINEIM